MAEIRYTVGLTFPEAEAPRRWLDWLRNGHIAAVIAGGAKTAEIFKIDGSDRAFEVVYRFPDRETFERYEKEVAPALRVEGQSLFPAASGIIYRRQVAEVM